MSLYAVKLYIGITTCKSFSLSFCVLFISVIQSAKCKFLNITCLLFLPAGVAPVFAPPPTRVIFPLTSI